MKKIVIPKEGNHDGLSVEKVHGKTTLKLSTPRSVQELSQGQAEKLHKALGDFLSEAKEDAA